MIVLLAAAAAGATVIPSDRGSCVSLDGQWRFKLEQADPLPKAGNINAKQPAIRVPEHFEPFEQVDYREDESWHDLKVPGNWEMAGYSAATYGHSDNAIGLYRLWFDVPSAYQGKLVKLNFDGVQNGAEVYLNGQSVEVSEPWGGKRNYHEGGYDAFQVDLTPAVKFGQKNLLAVRVYKNTHSVDMDTGDYFFLGGIHRSVTLFAVEPTHVEDLAVRTRLLEGGKAEVRLVVEVSQQKASSKLSLQLEGESAFEEPVNISGITETVHTIDHPRLWSAEHPNLYKLSIHLIDAQGHATEQVDRKIGICEVTIKDGVLLVNGVPVKLTGICRHELDPALGSACDETVWQRDLTLMRAANINAIRTSHYPYASGFYDLCDEMGFYVADEMAACWVPTDTDALSPAFAQHAREVVGRDKNHPSVILWAIGNENKPGKNNRIAVEEIRRLDPTRPRLVSTETADLADVELDDAHYPNPARVASDVKDPRRNGVPMVYLENPNVWEARNGADFGCLDLWANVIDRAWTDIWRDEHFAGSFLWEWRDRAVADPAHLYDYDPATGMDSVKLKGLCDAFGNPRASYYQLKMVYAPIKVELKPVVEGHTVTVRAANHYSFTNLSELNTTWHLLSANKELDHGNVHPPLAPNQAGDLKFNFVPDLLAKADALQIDFDNPDGLNVVTYQLRLRPEKIDIPAVETPSVPITFPQLNLTTVTYAPNRIGWHTATRHAGMLKTITIKKRGGAAAVQIIETDLYRLPLTDVESMDADIVLRERPDAVLAHIRAIFEGNQFAYQLKWTGTAADIQELGWAFTAGKTENHFSWHRQGYWSWYPSTAIGRITGTATPDSADVDITKITRADAFDFNSTKYKCDWASLTDSASRGILIRFDSDNRHHCRGDLNPDGTYRLIINRQTSPPRDISSNVVPDLYLKLRADSQVTGKFNIGAKAQTN